MREFYVYRRFLPVLLASYHKHAGARQYVHANIVSLAGCVDHNFKIARQHTGLHPRSGAAKHGWLSETAVRIRCVSCPGSLYWRPCLGCWRDA